MFLATFVLLFSKHPASVACGLWAYLGILTLLATANQIPTDGGMPHHRCPSCPSRKPPIGPARGCNNSHATTWGIEVDSHEHHLITQREHYQLFHWVTVVPSPLCLVVCKSNPPMPPACRWMVCHEELSAVKCSRRTFFTVLVIN